MLRLSFTVLERFKLNTLLKLKINNLHCKRKRKKYIYIRSIHFTILENIGILDDTKRLPILKCWYQYRKFTCSILCHCQCISYTEVFLYIKCL